MRKVAKGRVVKLFTAQDGKCIYCQRGMFLVGDDKHPLFATVEHRHPLSKGGRHHKDNWASSCCQCNTIKDDLNEEEFSALLRDLGGIHAVTVALRGLFVAKMWEEASLIPIEPQPNIKPEPAPPKKLKKRKPVCVADSDEWISRIYDLKKHTAVETGHMYKSSAQSCAYRHIIFKGRNEPSRFVCKVHSKNGEQSFLYKRGGDQQGWTWT